MVILAIFKLITNVKICYFLTNHVKVKFDN